MCWAASCTTTTAPLPERSIFGHYTLLAVGDDVDASFSLQTQDRQHRLIGDARKRRLTQLAFALQPLRTQQVRGPGPAPDGGDRKEREGAHAGRRRPRPAYCLCGTPDTCNPAANIL